MIERWQDSASARTEWTRLALEARNVFATWEWADAWVRHVPSSGRQEVFTVSEGGGTAAILPLWLQGSRGVRMLRFVGYGAGDYLGPICSPRHAALAMGGLREAMEQLAPNWDILLAENLAKPAWDGLIGGRTLKREISPNVPIAGQSWEDYVASRTPKLRRDIRVHERRLSRDHEVRFRLVDQPQHLQRELEVLFSLHAMRWGADSQAMGESRQAFHRDFAARALERGWLRLWFLDVDGSPVAAAYGFRFADADWYYGGGRDPEWERAGVGSILIAHTMREAFQDGLFEYKMLRGDEAYKMRFASQADELVTLAVGRGLRGRAGVRVAAEAREHRSVARMMRRLFGRERWQSLGGVG
jgi:CelD/BcsL family acetyltransferase involved in cellulose biosynthesis